MQQCSAPKSPNRSEISCIVRNMSSSFNRRKRNLNILKVILDRQTYGSSVPQDIRMIRTMIENDREFKKVFEMPSRSAIAFTADRLYFDSFSTCYKLSNVRTEPPVLYSLPRRPFIVTSKHRVKRLLHFECPLDQTTFCEVKGTFYANGPYTIGLTEDNYLNAFDINSGKALEQVYLSSSGRKFRYLNWETDFERVVVQSTLLPQNSTAHVMHRVPSDTDQILSYFAIFEATPLLFICMLPISYDIFGADACNASVGNGMLIVRYRRQKLQFFSLHDILQNHTTPLKLGEYLKPGNNLFLPEMDEFTSGVVGKPPLGLPVNVTLLEKPCVLFEVTCSNYDLSFGGYPWHYITTIDEVFYVRSVKDHALAENGMLCRDSLSLGTETAIFHTDLSGRVLFITSTSLSSLKLCSAGSNSETTTYKLSEQYKLDYCPPTKASNNVQTKSGRKVKQLLNQNNYTEIIQDFDYEDELDLFVVLYLSQTTKGEGIIGFYDNQTGKCIRTLNVEGISEQGEHSLAIDRNTLVIISKDGSSFRCLVYVLV